MAVDSEVVELDFQDVVAAVAIPVAIQCNDADYVKVYYGLAMVEAVPVTDFTVALNPGDDFEDFEVTPTASLITKINDLITADPEEENTIVVRRQLDYISDFTETDAFLRQRIADEFDRTIMRMQQLAHDFGLITGLATAAADAIAAAGVAEAARDETVAARDEAEQFRDEAQAAVNGVRVTASDTTPGPLDTKITVAGLATKSVTSPAGDERLQINVPKANQATAQAGVNDTDAMTAVRTWDAILAALVAGYAPLPKNYVSPNLVLSNDAGDTAHDIRISTGECRSDDDTMNMRLAAHLIKRLDATFVAGSNAGGMDAGAMANNTWYHGFVIGNPTTGAVDGLFSTSLSSPALPTGFTKKKYVGSVKTDGSAALLQFVQIANRVEWLTAYTEEAGTAIDTTERTSTLGGVPLGVRTVAKLSAFINCNNGRAHHFYPTDLNNPTITADAGPSTFGGRVTDGAAAASNLVGISGITHVLADASAQIRRKASGASTLTQLWTLGFEYLPNRMAA